MTRRLSPTRASTLSHRQCASSPAYKSRRLGLAPPRRASGVHRYILANLHRRLQFTCDLRALSEIVEDHGFLEPIKPLLVESVAAQEGLIELKALVEIAHELYVVARRLP